MDISRSIISGIGISLGDLELVTEYLYGEENLFEPELSEVKSVVSNKNTSQIVKRRGIEESRHINDVMKDFELEMQECDTEEESEKSLESFESSIWNTEVQSTNILSIDKGKEDNKQITIDDGVDNDYEEVDIEEYEEEKIESYSEAEEYEEELEIEYEKTEEYEEELEIEYEESEEYEEAEDYEEEIEEYETETNAQEECNETYEAEVDNQEERIEYEESIKEKNNSKIEIERNLSKEEKQSYKDDVIEKHSETVIEKAEAIKSKTRDNNIIRGSTNTKEEAKKKSINYSEMDVSTLYKYVKRYMLNNGVNKGMIDIDDLIKIFGKENIHKLINRGYLIKIGKGVTAGV